MAAASWRPLAAGEYLNDLGERALSVEAFERQLHSQTAKHPDLDTPASKWTFLSELTVTNCNNDVAWTCASLEQQLRKQARDDGKRVKRVTFRLSR